MSQEGVRTPLIGGPQVRDEDAAGGHDTPVDPAALTFDDYRASLSENAATAGMAAAESADLDHYGDEALEIIRRRAALGLETSAGDVRDEIGSPPSKGILGAAFRRAAAGGAIRHLRYRRSRAVSRRGGTESVWGPAR